MQRVEVLVRRDLLAGRIGELLRGEGIKVVEVVGNRVRVEVGGRGFRVEVRSEYRWGEDRELKREEGERKRRVEETSVEKEVWRPFEEWVRDHPNSSAQERIEKAREMGLVV